MISGLGMRSYKKDSTKTVLDIKANCNENRLTITTLKYKLFLVSTTSPLLYLQEQEENYSLTPLSSFWKREMMTFFFTCDQSRIILYSRLGNQSQNESETLTVPAVCHCLLRCSSGRQVLAVCHRACRLTKRGWKRRPTSCRLQTRGRAAAACGRAGRDFGRGGRGREPARSQAAGRAV